MSITDLTAASDAEFRARVDRFQAGQPVSGAELLLDELDQARAAATPGPWSIPYPLTKLIDGPEAEVASAENPADAALIVAAVNAIPELLRLARERYALERALLDLIDPENGMATGNGYDSTRLFDEKDIRSAITTALDPS